VKAVKRLGKNFYVSCAPLATVRTLFKLNFHFASQMILSSPPHPIFHFGMSGRAQVRGEPAQVYRVPRSKTSDEEWPPKYMKFCCVLRDDAGNTSEWAFCDPRRLGRLKLVDCDEGDIENVKPLSELGADPFLNMPTLEQLSTALLKRHAPIKAVLLDQNGPLCGIGNYMIDEICYQSRLHPSHPSSALSSEQLATLHTQIQVVTNTAVSVDADASRFPTTWLFSARWNKGKKVQNEFVLVSYVSLALFNDSILTNMSLRTISRMEPRQQSLSSLSAVERPPSSIAFKFYRKDSSRLNREVNGRRNKSTRKRRRGTITLAR